MYLVHKDGVVIAKGKVIYETATGNILKFTSNSNEKEVYVFIKNLIHYFGEMNYIAKLNAMDKPSKKAGLPKRHTTKTNNTNKRKTTVEYLYTDSKEQPSYVPKRIHLDDNSQKTDTKKPLKNNPHHENHQNK